MSFVKYACKTQEQIEQEFGSSVKSGLSDSQLIINKNKYGANVLIKKEKTWLDFLIIQYESPIVLLLMGAAYLSLFLGEYINAITIFCIIIINTCISFYQEYSASKQVKLLAQYLEQTSKVIRNGKQVSIDSKKLVPGDIILLEPGDHIPADVRFVQANSLSVNESALSGESMPVIKKSEKLDFEPKNIFCANNIGFSGTVVVAGTAIAIVFATGQETSFGKISDLTTTTIRETKFFKNIRKISYFLLKIIAVTLILLVILHLIFEPSDIAISQILMFSVALALGLAPEALPSITTLSLSRGAILLARNKVIVKRLSSIEDFGGLEIICTDKTGTITENKLTIEEINSPVYGYKKSLMYMALSSTRPFVKRERPLNPFDSAAWDKLAPGDFDEILKYKLVNEIPFDSKHRRNLVLIQDGNLESENFANGPVKNNNVQIEPVGSSGAILIVNGDYEEVASRSNLSQEEKDNFRVWINEKAKAGCRVIAIAKKNIGNINIGSANFDSLNISEHENDMDFVALVALFDPIRKTVIYSLDQARKLGLQVKIITGDDAAIAGNIAVQIGLIKNIEDIVTGEEFSIMSEKEKERIAKVVSVFARFLPEQKHEIIKILKKDKSVGYLGDGINDAPALKEADVGFAVQGAVDIAKDAADIILLKKSLVTIVDGIKIGRAVFVNTFNYLKISLSANIGNFFSMAIISLFIPFLPLLPLQILLVNLLSDSPMIAISTDNVNPVELARPTSYNLRHLVIFICIFGFINSVFDFVFFFNFYNASLSSSAFVQTNWFIFNIITAVSFIFSGRTKQLFVAAVRPSYWLLLFSFLAVAITLILPYTQIGQTMFSFVTPTFSSIFIIFGIGAGYFASCEIFKLFYYKFIVPNNNNA